MYLIGLSTRVGFKCIGLISSFSHWPPTWLWAGISIPFLKFTLRRNWSESCGWRKVYNIWELIIVDILPHFEVVTKEHFSLQPLATASVEKSFIWFAVHEDGISILDYSSMVSETALLNLVKRDLSTKYMDRFTTMLYKDGISFPC